MKKNFSSDDSLKKETETSPAGFVFLDHRGSRWRRIRVLALLLSIVSIVAGVIFVHELFIWPQLPLPENVRDLKKKLRAVESVRTDPALQMNTERRRWLRFIPRDAQRHYCSRTARPAVIPALATELCVAAYSNGDAASLQSLKKHKDLVTHVVPDWFSLTKMDLEPQEVVDDDLLSFLKNKHIILMPRLSNLLGNECASDAVEALIRTHADRQERFIRHLLAALTRIKAGGVVIDWQGLDPAYSPELVVFLQRLSNQLHANGLQLWIYVPVDDGLSAFNLKSIASFADKLIARLHGENSIEDTPGPLASQPWFEDWLHVLLGYGEPGKWVICLGSYGLDWSKSNGIELSFADVLARGAYAGLTTCKSDQPEYNPHFSYQTNDGATHAVWFLDASTFLNQLKEVEQEGCGGVMIDRLGLEDPSIWSLLESPEESLKTEAVFDKMRIIKPAHTLANVGEGDFIEADMATSQGERSFSIDREGKVCVDYKIFPHYVTLYHQASGKPNEVALTFDDGPSPYTPQILDILARYHVHATFFLIGKQCEKYPKLVRRILAEGHTIGSHTYTHHNLSESSEEQTILELNATQRLLEWLTGRSTVLFRPPYNADSSPRNIEDVRPLALANSMGYLSVCERVDLEDWQRPPPSILLQRLRERRPLGNVILLHDGGGDRSGTVEALPHIIEYLRARGDDIVSVEKLLGMSQDILMPTVKQSNATIPRLIANIGLLAYQWLEGFVWSFMLIATTLLLLRTLIVAGLAFLNKRRKGNVLYSKEKISGVSVVIAAYNEGKVIQETLASVFRTDFPGTLEVIVVDDGSKDDTAVKIAQFLAENKKFSLDVIRQANQGKAHALRRGLAACKEEIVVFLDADTHCNPQTIPALLAAFSRERIGAVAGHARVGNLRGWIARFQALEYICGFNLDRRAYDLLNAITVVPGAISAFRRKAISDAGGISGNTLAEDTDLTLSLHRARWRIAYAPEAVAWTEAPETISTLVRQRLRWAFGTLQCLWKHRDMLFNIKFGALGWFALPSVWFFQVILVAAGPIVDVLLLISLFVGNGGALIIYFVAFLITDFILAGLACRLDGEPLYRALYILPMRFLYRPLLSYVVWMSIIRCLKGAWVEWGKLERKGIVPAAHGPRPQSDFS